MKPSPALEARAPPSPPADHFAAVELGSNSFLRLAHMKAVGKRFGSTIALDGVHFSFSPGEVAALVEEKTGKGWLWSTRNCPRASSLR